MVTMFFVVHARKDVLFSDQQILWLLFWADDSQRLELPKLLHLEYVIDMMLQNDGIIQYVVTAIYQELIVSKSMSHFYINSGQIFTLFVFACGLDVRPALFVAISVNCKHIIHDKLQCVFVMV